MGRTGYAITGDDEDIAATTAAGPWTASRAAIPIKYDIIGETVDRPWRRVRGHAITIRRRQHRPLPDPFLNALCLSPCPATVREDAGPIKAASSIGSARCRSCNQLASARSPDCEGDSP